MAWEVEYTEEFEVWWDALTVAEQIDVDAAVRLLESKGPNLGVSAEFVNPSFQARPYARAAHPTSGAALSGVVRL
jgi:hypothetical protein